MSTEVLSTQAAGNTIQPLKALRARAFLLTLNEVERYEALSTYLKHYKAMDYLIAAKELAPSTGHAHIHIYVHFNNARSLDVSKCEGAHIDICRGSPKQNIDYVSKDGDIIEEVGNKPHQGMISIGDIKKMNSDEIDSLPWMMQRTAKAIKEEQEYDIDIDSIFKSDMKVIYICGPSGIGKSKRAFEIAKENGYSKINMVKFDGSFWHG